MKDENMNKDKHTISGVSECPECECDTEVRECVQHPGCPQCTVCGYCDITDEH